MIQYINLCIWDFKSSKHTHICKRRSRVFCDCSGLALKTYQNLTLGRSNSIDENEWHGNKALSVKQGEQNANWQSSNSVQQNIHTKETFLWSVIHPLLKISFVWYSWQEKKDLIEHKNFEVTICIHFNIIWSISLFPSFPAGQDSVIQRSLCDLLPPCVQ